MDSNLTQFAEKTGIVQSMLAHLRRNMEKRLIDAPPAGTPLLVSLAGSVEHSGLFLGDSHVAELNGNGRLLDVSLYHFLNGYAEDSTNVRTGTRIFAACDDATGRPLASLAAVETAHALIRDVDHVDYNLLVNNCHLFTSSCLRGGMLEAKHWLRDGTYAINCLQSVISEVLNDGRPVAWLGVRGSSSGFRYALTKEKRDRLRNEGKLI